MDVVNILVEKLESRENMLSSHERQEVVEGSLMRGHIQNHAVKSQIFPHVSLEDLLYGISKFRSSLLPSISNHCIHKFADYLLLPRHASILITSGILYDNFSESCINNDLLLEKMLFFDFDVRVLSFDPSLLERLPFMSLF